MMSTKRDYYEILGVPKASSAEEIKKVYRKLVMEHHPDRVPEAKKKEAEEKFKEISEAYAVLSDSKKRQLYDQFGHAGIDSRYSTEDIFRGADFSDIFRGMGGFESIFEGLFSDSGFDIFGTGRGSRRRVRQGEDIHLELPITLQEAGSGVEKEIYFYRHDACSQCKGSGAQPGSTKETCAMCKGRGQVSTGVGFFSFTQPCPACRGEGKVIKNRCTRCGGNGSVKTKRNIKVKVPQGVDTGSILRLRQEGHFGPGGHGDLYVHVGVRPHPDFKRDGDDIKCKLKLSVLKAILGGEIEVPTLDGKVKMKIPPGTQPNTVFRLKEKGITDLRTKRPGDELVEVDIEIPRRLSMRERRLLDEWKKLRKEM